MLIPKSYHRYEIMPLDFIGRQAILGAMVTESLRSGLKLAAIDLDGTLLDAEAQMSAANGAAVRRLMRAGLHVVLASGRHYLNMRRYAAAVPGIEWLVSCQGAEVSSVERTTTLATHFLPGPAVAKAIEAGRSLGFTPLAYRFDGVFTDSTENDDLAFYTALAGTPPVRCGSPGLVVGDAFKVLWVGAPDHILRGRELNPLTLGGIETVQTHARILEIMPAGVTKASGLSILAQQLGISADEVVAFGDGENDISMFDWAGLSIAMPHGWRAALEHATSTAPAGPADTAFARAVDLALSREGTSLHLQAGSVEA
jgi:Cof subfamily protein (haloacid dehalogenase superfamily)